MKYSVNTYARALVAAIDEGKANDAAIEKNFLEVVRQNGDEAQLRKILDEASRLARGTSSIRHVLIESARPLTARQRSEVKRFMKAHDEIDERIDPDLIAGVKITINDEQQFDGSLKKKLNRALGNA